MVDLLWALLGLSVIIIFILATKIYLLQKSTREICDAFSDRLTMDTNTLIDISSRDKYMRRLVASINDQLRLLRRQRYQYLNGDRELKEAVTNISHDLRTPLTAICGYLDLLEQEEKSENVTRYLSYIENRTQALKQLTEELFRYSVIISTDETMAMESVSLNAVLEESIAAFYAALSERGITPVIHMPEETVTRQLNKAALSRVLGNILNNTLKYSDVDLEIEMKDTGEIVFTNTASKLDEVQVGKLFDRFFTVEAARNSTGLGLAISKTLVEQMNGEITADYKKGRISVSILFRKHESI